MIIVKVTNRVKSEFAPKNQQNIQTFIEDLRKLSGDDAHHNLLQRPRDNPVRTSLGMMAIAFFVVVLLWYRAQFSCWTIDFTTGRNTGLPAT